MRWQWLIFGFLTIGGLGGLAQPPLRESEYIAFRSTKPIRPELWKSLLDQAAGAGIVAVESRALQREGILVFRIPDDPALHLKLPQLSPAFIPIPVREYRGVLSVSSGYFYLKFQDAVPPAEIKKLVMAAGFRIVSPDLEPGALLVVEASRLPANRDAELAKLKQLPRLRYAAPHDIPLLPSKSDRN